MTHLELGHIQKVEGVGWGSEQRHKRQFLKPYQCPQNIPRDVFPHSLTYLAFFRNSCCDSPKTAQRRKNKWLLIVLWVCFQIPLMMLLWSKGLCGPKSACENTMLPTQAFRAGPLEDNPIRSPSLHCGISTLKRRPQTTSLPLPSTNKNARKLPSPPSKLAGTLNLDFFVLQDCKQQGSVVCKASRRWCCITVDQPD